MLLVCIGIFLCCIIPVYAHPGNTDADGGHWDYDAGEYHYHHGYPAHDHYDANGDGFVDCPYDFDDQTGVNSGSPSSGGTYTRNYASYDDEPPETITVYKDREVIKEVPVTPTWIKWALGVSIVWLLYLIMSNRAANDWNANLERSIEHLNQKAKEQESSHKAELQKMYEVYKDKCFQFGKTHKEELDALQAEIGSLKKELHSVISYLPIGEVYFPSNGVPKQIMYQLEIPLDIYFINGTTPVCGIIADHKPFGDLTVYVSQRGRCYHSDYYCGSGMLYAKHAYETIDKLPPCKNCGIPFREGIPHWYTQFKKISPQLLTQPTHSTYQLSIPEFKQSQSIDSQPVNEVSHEQIHLGEILDFAIWHRISAKEALSEINRQRINRGILPAKVIPDADSTDEEDIEWCDELNN